MLCSNNLLISQTFIAETSATLWTVVLFALLYLAALALVLLFELQLPQLLFHEFVHPL